MFYLHTYQTHWLNFTHWGRGEQRVCKISSNECKEVYFPQFIWSCVSNMSHLKTNQTHWLNFTYLERGKQRVYKLINWWTVQGVLSYIHLMRWIKHVFSCINSCFDIVKKIFHRAYIYDPLLSERKGLSDQFAIWDKQRKKHKMLISIR